MLSPCIFCHICSTVTTVSADKITKSLTDSYAQLCGVLGYYHYLTDEITQVHGYISLSDWSSHTLVKEMKVSMETKKKLATMTQVGYFRFAHGLFPKCCYKHTYTHTHALARRNTGTHTHARTHTYDARRDTHTRACRGHTYLLQCKCNTFM